VNFSHQIHSTKRVILQHDQHVEYLTVNSGNTGQGVSTKGLGYIYPSRSIPIPGALFHHIRDILLIV
ncbi:hypothetical protein ACV3J7_23235, partial [Salmonella enterica subsp. enterica serovar 3,10:z10:-]